jgi:adenosylcobinamide-phosphate synthase
MGALLACGRRLLGRGSPLLLCLGGGLLVIAVAALAATAARAVEWAAQTLGAPGVVLEALALSLLLSLRGLSAAARAVAESLKRGDLATARGQVGRHLVSRPTDSLDEAHVASAAVESVAENLTDSVIAPLCCFLVFGLAGAAAYRVVNTADAMLGYREGPLEWFGKVAARLDDVLNAVPARLAALALVAAAAITSADGRGALRTAWHEHGRTASPNAGWTMAAMAGALGVRLEKTDHYQLGTGRWPAAPDIDRSIGLTQVAAWLTIAAVAVLVSGWSVFKSIS